MRNKKVKQLRKLAKAMETENTMYVHKTTKHVYTDPISQLNFAYTTQQTRLIPQCIKRIVKTLKGATEPWTLEYLKKQGYHA